ncbi:MAG: stage V sporulation protein AC [Oscillospiraceae bacterium]|nr:stage V sporulation protein AC [Oscillospiraceae bacterium]
MLKKYTKEEYKKYVEQKSPNSPLLKNMLFAFLIGGAICVIGQGIGDFYERVLNMETETVRALVPITLIFLGALATGLNIYDDVAKFAGAGTLVPITGFANSIVAPAMEFKKEGYVLGLAAKMFVIAGPVLVYGIVTSIIGGLIYYLII